MASPIVVVLPLPMPGYLRCTAARTFDFSSGEPCCDTRDKALRACEASSKHRGYGGPRRGAIRVYVGAIVNRRAIAAEIKRTLRRRESRRARPEKHAEIGS